MDKYSINEEDGYNDPPTSDLPIISNAHSFKQSVRIKNNEPENDEEFNQRVGDSLNKLSAVEQKIFKLVMNGYSISRAANKLNISQQRASKCWNLIQDKLSL